MEIKVLGAGCSSCRKMEELTRQAVRELGIAAEVEKMTDIGEMARFGVRVNAVAPGLVESDVVSAMPAEQRERLLANVPLGRVGKAEEVASVVRFLASDEASYITGEVIKVTGGI